MKDLKLPGGHPGQRGVRATNLMRKLTGSSIRRTLGICLLPIALAACAGLPSAGGDGTAISGTVIYLQRIALPPDAVVHVRLDDVGRADAPAVTLARQTVPTDGRQVPIPFTLDYDPGRIEPGHRYVIRAAIRDGNGNLRWTTGSPPPVLTRGAPADDIEVRVVPVSGSYSALVGPTWRLVLIETSDGAVMRPDADEIDTVTFEADGRLGGKADCNHFFGRYTVDGDGGLTVSQVGSTLAACLSPSLADTFLREITGVESFALAGGRLRLTTGDGSTLVFTLNSRRSVWERARLSGIDFRAIGQEPGWLLDIRAGQRIRFLYDYGEEEVIMPAPEPTIDRQAGRTVYRAGTEAHDLTVTITDEPCTDVMSGQSFEASVAVYLDGETYRGCGRALH